MNHFLWFPLEKGNLLDWGTVDRNKVRHYLQIEKFWQNIYCRTLKCKDNRGNNAHLLVNVLLAFFLPLFRSLLCVLIIPPNLVYIECWVSGMLVWLVPLITDCDNYISQARPAAAVSVVPANFNIEVGSPEIWKVLIFHILGSSSTNFRPVPFISLETSWYHL